MNYKTFVAALAVLTVVGCASNTATLSEPEEQPVATAATDGDADVLARTERTDDAEDRVICRVITPTGSHRKKTVCRTVKEIRDDRNSAQDALRTKQGGVAGSSDQ